MLYQVLIPGLVLGIISSFHCVGMCGPLALSLPLTGLSTGRRLAGILLYNLGRITTYTLLGVFFGMVGRRIFIAGYQQWFSVAAGVVMLLFFVLALLHRQLAGIRRFNKAFTGVQSLVAYFMRLKSLPGVLLTGMANGLLPCGMVYLAITGAAATGSIGYGALFMAAFGLGTVPALLLLSLAGFFISVQARVFMRRLTPYAFLLMSILLILRGLNLGIPYLSPSFAASSKVIPCH